MHTAVNFSIGRPDIQRLFLLISLNFCNEIFKISPSLFFKDIFLIPFTASPASAFASASAPAPAPYFFINSLPSLCKAFSPMLH